MNTYFLNLSESLVDQFPTQDRFVTDLNLNFQPVFFFFFFLIAQFVIILSPANNYLLKVKNTLENAVKYSQS